MTFHDKRMSAARKVGSSRRYRLMKEGAFTLNLWNAMPVFRFGSVEDDWKAVGDDMRRALAQYADERG